MRVADVVRDHVTQLRDAAAEREQAVDRLAHIPLADWPAAMRADPHFRTAPVLAYVFERAREALGADAGIAVRLTGTALEFVPDDAVVLRGRGLTTHAQALRATGDGTRARAALREALCLLTDNPLGTTQLQAAHMVAALFAHDEGDDDRALQFLDTARRSCAAEGNERGLLKAGLLQAGFLYENGEVGRADQLWASLLPVAERLRDDVERARILLNRGHCARRQQRYEDAARLFAAALPLFHTCGMDGEAQKIVWGVASIARERGHLEAALPILARARNAFVARGMILEAGILSLDMLDLLVLAGAQHRVRPLAVELVALFTDAHMPAQMTRVVAHLVRERVTRAMIARARRSLRRIE